MTHALRVVRLKSILFECLRVHYECVRFDRVFDICRSNAGWGASRRVTTLFSFEAAGQRALGLSVDGEVQLRIGEDYVAALAREGDWQSLVALYDVANRRYHGPDAVHGAFLFAGLIPLYLAAPLLFGSAGTRNWRMVIICAAVYGVWSSMRLFFMRRKLARIAQNS